MAAAAAFAILNLELLQMPWMAAPRTRRQSKRFVSPSRPASPDMRPTTTRRLVVPEGDWQSIRSDLELRGWSSSQLEVIQTELSQGWPLRIAIRHAAMRLGTCPTGSQALG